jgi:hypothetical protein
MSESHATAAGEGRSLEDLRGQVEEIRAQLHWVRDYL